MGEVIASQVVLVFDDDMGFREGLTRRLGRSGFGVLTAASVRVTLELAPRAHFAFLDLHAPGLSLEAYPDFLLDLRRVNPGLVSVLLTGDDSYQARALASRINLPWYSKATITDDLPGLAKEIRAFPVDGRCTLPCGGVIDHRERTFTHAGQMVKLTGTEYRLFRALAERFGLVVTNEDLMVVSHLTLEANTSALQNHVSRMRKSFRKAGFVVALQAVPNEGYRLSGVRLEREIAAAAAP